MRAVLAALLLLAGTGAGSAADMTIAFTTFGCSSLELMTRFAIIKDDKSATIALLLKHMGKTGECAIMRAGTVVTVREPETMGFICVSPHLSGAVRNCLWTGPLALK